MRFHRRRTIAVIAFAVTMAVGIAARGAAAPGSLAASHPAIPVAVGCLAGFIVGVALVFITYDG